MDWTIYETPAGHSFVMTPTASLCPPSSSTVVTDDGPHGSGLCGPQPVVEHVTSDATNDRGRLVSKISGQGVFFSKYFPGKDSLRTHLHWKKVISERNEKAQSAQQVVSRSTGSPIPMDTTSRQWSPAADASSKVKVDANAASSSHWPKSHTGPRDHQELEKDNYGSRHAFDENYYPTGKDGNPVKDSPCSHRNMSLRYSTELHLRSRIHHMKNDSCSTAKDFVASGLEVAGTDGNAAQGQPVQESALTSTTLDSQQAPVASSTHLPALPSLDACPPGSGGAQGQPGREPARACPGGGEVVSAGVETVHSEEAMAAWGQGVDSSVCQVCGDTAAGFYCGAFVCEACKKFFIRASKQDKQKFVCLRDSQCKITKESRVQCQSCRYKKCLTLRMHYPGEGKRSVGSIQVSGIPCRVCGSPSSGFHFGALTCEGCKGFFRRMVKEREPGTYKCSSGGTCQIGMHTRNMCKACRYQKCISNGMSVEGSRIGRQPNAVKHAISLEVKKQRLERQPPSEPTSRVLPTVDRSKASGVTGQESESVDQTGQPFMSDVPFPPPPPEEVTPPAGPPASEVEVKDDPETAVILSDAVLTEVNPGVVVKQEPECSQLMGEGELLTCFQAAGKELSNMCLSRCKDETLDREEFASYQTLWKKQMRHFQFNSQCCIRFTKKIPGFKDVALDDKVTLVQNAVYPIVILNLSRMYELRTGFYNFFNFTKPEEVAVLSMCPEYVTFQEHFKHMGVMVQTMKMTHMEFTLLSCLLLSDTDCPGLTDLGQVEKLQSGVMGFLQTYVASTHPGDPGRLGDLLLRLGDLRLASEQHIQTITSFLSQHPELQLPQMFKEMFF